LGHIFQQFVPNISISINLSLILLSTFLSQNGPIWQFNLGLELPQLSAPNHNHDVQVSQSHQKKPLSPAQGSSVETMARRQWSALVAELAYAFRATKGAMKRYLYLCVDSQVFNILPVP
jgi:hypothetical protein